MIELQLLASFKIKFSHNCDGYNGNLLHLEITIKESEVGVWLQGSSDLRLKESQREIVHTPWYLQKSMPGSQLGMLPQELPLVT